MIESEGWVEAVAEPGRVQFRPLSSGGGCGSCSGRGCGSGASFLGLASAPAPALLTARDDWGARPGQRVVVGLPEGVVLRAAFAQYLGPLLGLFAGAGLLRGVGGFLGLAATEGVTLLGAAAGMGAAFYWLRGFSRRLSRDPRFEPQVLRGSDTVCHPEQA